MFYMDCNISAAVYNWACSSSVAYLSEIKKIEVPTDTPTVFQLGHIAADIQRRENIERWKEGTKTTNKREGEGGSQEGRTMCPTEEVVAEK